MPEDEHKVVTHEWMPPHEHEPNKEIVELCESCGSDLEKWLEGDR